MASPRSSGGGGGGGGGGGFRVWAVRDAGAPRAEELEEPARLLREGAVVAFATETVYGLGACASSDEALAGVFRAKGRPSDNPLIVHVSSREMAAGLCAGGALPAAAARLAEAFWPGPLTVVVPVARAAVSRLCTAGLDTVGLRMPDHPVALALIARAGVPVAAPSANVSGRPSPTVAAHVAGDLEGTEVRGVVDGGSPRVGVESTVVDCSRGEGEPVVVLRPGGVTVEQLRAVLGDAAVAAGAAELGVPADEAPRAPGMKYTHYAPRAPLVLVDGGDAFFERCVAEQAGGGARRVGVLVPEEARGLAARGLAAREVVCGRRDDAASVARGVYAALREFDLHDDVDVILAPCFARDGLGDALMNRLAKAAGGRVLREAGRQ